jgi:tetratricopeptide (TPR) repeat protein
MTSANPSAEIMPPQLRRIAPYFAFVLAVFVAYGNVFNSPFVLDDRVLILTNTFLRGWQYLPSILTSAVTAGGGIAGGFYRPLQIFIYFLIYQAVGPSLFAFHVLNLILHAANACLLYRFGCKLGFNARAMFLAVLLWALHPVQVEAVAYMSSTADMLYVFFSLIALLILLLDFTPRKCMLVLPLFLLGMLSKEEAVMLPLLAMSCLYLLSERRFRAQTYTRTWPLWLGAILYALAHRYLLSFGDYPFYPANLPYTSSILCRVYTALATLPEYLSMLVWPTHLRFYRNLFPVFTLWHLPTLEGLAIVVLSGAQIMLARSRAARALSWGLLWFAAAHILHTGILVPLNSMLLEHWLYMPSAGLFLGIAESLSSLRPKHAHKIGATLIALGLALILGVLTYNQNTMWHDEEQLYLNVFRNGEPSLDAHDNLGAYYAEHGDYEKAIQQYQNVIDLSRDRNAFAEYNLGVALLLLKNDAPAAVPEAIAHMKRALEIDPNFYEAADKLSFLYGRLGDEKNAAFYRAKAKTLHDALTHGAPEAE